MFDESLRARASVLLRPVARLLLRLRVRPNHVTWLTFALALIAAALVASGRPRAGLAVWLASRIGDGLDGVVARQSGRVTAFGGYLDITLDMAAYAAMVLGFAAAHPALAPAWMAVLAGYILVITSTLALSDAARAAGVRIGATDRTFQLTPGLTEAGETTVMYALWALLPQHLSWLVWLWAAMLAATVVQRSMLAARRLP